MKNQRYAIGHWSLAIAGFAAFTLLSAPVRAQEENSTVVVGQTPSVEVEAEMQTVERVESQTVEVETQVQTTQVETTQVETREVEVSATQMTFTETVQRAVFTAIAQRASVNVSNLRIVEVSHRTWMDSCLGFVSQGGCTQGMMPGYLVTVTDGQQVWIYRTNATGSTVYWDERATQMRIAQIRARSTQIAFSDVPANHWAASFIRELAALDVIAGYPDGLYRPNAPVTRAEFAAIIRRAFSVSDIRNAIAFVDVDSDYWAATAIDQAYEMGFLNAVNNREFRPFAELYRGDVMVAIARGLRISTDETAINVLNQYSDVTVSSAEARLLLAALTKRGIVVNYPNIRELDLERVATRAEVAALVYQTLYSMGYVARIESPYVVQDTTIVTDIDSETVETGSTSNNTVEPRRNCNQGIGNGAEGCDPGNSRPHGGSNDEGGRTPGNRP